MSFNQHEFIHSISSSYNFESKIYVGAGFCNGEIFAEAKVHLPLSMMTRHGLVTGATGSGKTRTLQVIAEQLSLAGVPVFMPDIKGDLSGMALPGTTNSKIEERAKALGVSFQPTAFPLELYSLSGKYGAQMRSTISEFGPVLLSKILGLNDVQSGVLMILFKYSDDKALPLVDFSDVKKVLNYLSEGEGAKEIKADYGKITTSTAATILRKIVALEQQGIHHLFGEPSFDIDDLFSIIDGRGVISLLNVSDVQNQPTVFSTYLLALLVELYHTLPEVGDVKKPKLVFFIDEAHLLFKDASSTFLDHIDQIIRLIRSKGVGVFFCTQVTQDVPPTVLAQLGNRVHHVIRAFTPNDVKSLKETIKTFPHTGFYDLEKQFTQLGTGQAFISILNEKGIPTPSVATHIAPPVSVMGPLAPEEYNQQVKTSDSFKKYATAIDPQSAYEILSERIEVARGTEKKEEKKSPSRAEKSSFEKMMSSPVTRQIGRDVARGLLGMLFGTSTRRRRR